MRTHTPRLQYVLPSGHGIYAVYVAVNITEEVAMRVSAGRNIKDHVLLTSFASAEPSATKLLLRDHNIAYEGVPGTGVAWGVYGTTSTDRALYWAAHAAAMRANTALFTIEMSCALKNLYLLPAAIDRALVERTGFLHIRRLRSAFGAEIHELVLAHLARRMSWADLSSDRNRSLSELMMKYPAAASWILQSEPSVKLIVHPVQLGGSAHMIDVGTMRVAQAKVMTPRVKYMEDQVSVSY